MKKITALCTLLTVLCVASATYAAALRKVAQPRVGATSAAEFVDPTAYQIMYPALNNEMRTTLNPGVTPNFSPNSVSTLTRTNVANNARRVVARSAAPMATGSMAARAATTSSNQPPGPKGVTAIHNPQSTRRVVARSATTPIRSSNTTRVATIDSSVSISSSRCLADYTACMDDYCERPDTSYDRCYCSAKLSQIDATYQPAISELILELIRIRGGNYSDAEMDDYWQSVIGIHTGDNSWNNIDDALDIDWAGMEDRARGQMAFNTGHEYCVQHLAACNYMSSNLRDAYRSTIARDCTAYENGLERIKDAAESFIVAYE